MKTLACLAALGGCIMLASLATSGNSEATAPDEAEYQFQPAPQAPGTLAARMMGFDKDGDGKISRAEVTDDRLLGLFDRADANKDGAVSKDELSALERTEIAKGGRGGPGGPGGPGRMFGPPMRPGDVLPMMARQNLKLTDEQGQKLDALQKDVDAKLAEILTDEQEKELKQMRERGPGGPGGPPPGRGGRTKGAPPRPPEDR